MTSVPWFKLVAGNLKAPELTPAGSTHDWWKRRGSITDLMVKEKPDILMTVETGTPTQARWYRDSMALKGHKMNIATYNGDVSGHWRYIFYNPATVVAKASGRYDLSPVYSDGQVKEVSWLLAEIAGYKALFFCTHLPYQQNSTADAVRLAQAKYLVNSIIVKKMAQYGVTEDCVFVYMDCNSHHQVQEYLINTFLHDLKDAAGYKSGTEYKSQSDWKPRTATGRLVVPPNNLSMDILLGGPRRRASSYRQLDVYRSTTPSLTDHEIISATVNKYL